MAATESKSSSPLGSIIAKYVSAGTELVAFLFVDPSLAPSTAFMPKWEAVWKDVCGFRSDTPTDGEGDGNRLKTVLVVEDPGSKDMSSTALHPQWSVASKVMDIRRAARLSFVQTFPELVLVTPTGDVIATDGVQALRRGSLSPPAFPLGWRTNVLTAVVSAGPVDSSGCLVHPDTALQLGVYPGDTALVRGAVSGTGASACLFLNPPEPEHELMGGEGALGPSSCGIGTITFTPTVALNTGILAGEPVVVEPFLSLPQADSVTLAPLQAATSTHLAAPLHAFFGLPTPAPASGSADAPAPDLAQSVHSALQDHALSMGEGEGSGALASLLAQGGDSWLVKYASTAQCLRRPVGTGQVLVVPVTGPAALPSGTVHTTLLEGASPARTHLLTATAAAVDTANAGSGAGEAEGEGAALQFAGDQLGQAGVRWVAFVVTATAPRGTVEVGPDTTLTLA